MKTGSAGLCVAFYLVKKHRKKQERSLQEHVQNYRCDPPSTGVTECRETIRPVTRHRNITMTLKLLFKAEYFLLTLHRLSLSLSLSSGQCVHSQSKHKDPGEVDGSRSSDLPAFLCKIRRVVVRGSAV